MFKTLLTYVITLGGIMTGGAAYSEDFPATTAPPSASGDAQMKAMNEEFNADLNAQMEAAIQSMIDANMKDPRIQKAYQAYLQAGGQIDLRAYCIRYAEIGGFNLLYDQKNNEIKWADLHLIMKDPRAHRKYEDYLKQGGSMEFRAFCIRYAATCGFVSSIETYKEYLEDFNQDHNCCILPFSEFQFYKRLTSVSPQQMDRIPNETYLYRDTDGRFWMYQDNQWISIRNLE